MNLSCGRGFFFDGAQIEIGWLPIEGIAAVFNDASNYRPIFRPRRR